MPVINSLTSTSTTDALSAAAGALLYGYIKTLADGATQVGVVATAGQTAFVLPSAPINTASVVMHVNGIEYDTLQSDIVVAGTSVTWAGAFKLSPTDTVYFTYT